MADSERQVSAPFVTLTAAFGGLLASLACARAYPYALPISAALAGMVPGVAVGVIERGRNRASVVAALATVPFLFAGAFAGIPVAAAVAWGTRAIVETRGRGARDYVLVVALAFVLMSGVGFGVYSALQPDPNLGGATLARWLQQKPDLSKRAGDNELFLRVYQLQKKGAGYYEALFTSLQEWHPERPTDRRGAVNFRLPLPYVVWAAVPLSPLATLTGGLLLLGAIAAVFAFALGRSLGPPGLALASASWVMAWFASNAGTANVVMVEMWAGGLIVCSLAAWGLHRARSGDRIWLAASVVAGLMAALTRELAVFVLLAGLIAAVVGDRSDHRRTWPGWAAGLAVFAAAYWMHTAAVGGGLVSPRTGASFWLQGSILERMWVTWTWGDYFLPAAAAALPFVAIAVASAFVVRDRSLRAFAVAGVAIPTLALGFVGGVSTGMTPLGYWAALTAPALWSLLPAAYLLVLPLFLRTGQPTEPASG